MTFEKKWTEYKNVSIFSTNTVPNIFRCSQYAVSQEVDAPRNASTSLRIIIIQ